MRKNARDILFDRHAPYVGCDRPRQVQEILALRPEQLRIDATPPAHQVVKAARRELGLHALGADHAALRGAVKPAQQRIGRHQRNRQPRAQVLRKLRVIGGGEAQPVADAIAARGKSQRALGRNVQCLRAKCRDAAREFSLRQEGDADLRIGRAGDGAKVAWRHQPHLVSEAAEPCRSLSQSVDDAVGLGKPRIADDHDPHALRSVNRVPCANAPPTFP